MNSKGELLTSEVLKMVVAVICIGFLIYFLAALYFSNANSKDLVKANSLAEQIEKGFYHMEINSLTNFDIDDVSPQGWWVFGFGSGEAKPNFCSERDCVCICKKAIVLFGEGEEKQLQTCDEDGACVVVGPLKDFEDFKINREEGSFTSIRLVNSEGYLEVRKK